VSRLLRVLGVVVLALAGVVAGAAGVVVSRDSAVVAGVTVPYGLVLALATALLLFMTSRREGGVPGAVAAALGWLLPVVVLMWPRPEGDVVVSADVTGLVFVVVGVAAAGWGIARARRDRDDRDRRDGTVDGHARR
jgi:hypothetical protein